jgi:pilus assembly protein Flp/PilA
MTALLLGLWDDEAGATAVEYGVMVALIAVAIIITLTAVGVSLDTMFADPILNDALTP